ncbi:MAG: hypothetical protein UD936_01490 [Acutalibacteraceae bacterium]|nr:hypothetical protein [Acutalibacteraceae bacterium]
MKTKICKFCKKEYEARSGTQKYCSEQCRLKAKAVRKKAQSKSDIDLRANPHKLCTRKSCLYYSQTGPNRCDYFYLTNNLRGCKSGEACTRYKKATEDERKKYRNKVLRTDEEGRTLSVRISHYPKYESQDDLKRKYSKLIDKN